MSELTQPTAIELVQHFRFLRVLVVGDAMLDTYIEGHARRLGSEGPIPVIQKTTEERNPGGAANTAVNLRALGAEVAFLGIVGQDNAGSLLRSVLGQYDVSDRWLVTDTTACTLHKLRILADGQYVVRLDEGHTRAAQRDQAHGASAYTPATNQQVLQFLDELYPLYDVVVISDYCYGVVSHTLIERLQILQAAYPKPLLVDSKALLRFRHLPITVVTPNYQEGMQLLEQVSSEERVSTLSELEDSTKIAQQLQQWINAEHIAITLAQNGLLLLDRAGHVQHLPAHPVQHAHDIGAGDSLLAALALSLAAGGTIEEAASIALDAASIAVTKAQTAVVHYHELLQRVSLRVYTSQQYMQQEGDMQATLAQLAIQLELERLQGKTIVFTNGIFDILHVGHIQFLRQAQALGDVLVVALNSDQSVQRLKGPGRPIHNERDRLALVTALDMVDYVLLFDEDTPTSLIRKLRPHIHVKGGDYTNDELPEAEAVREVNGQVVIIPLAGSISTTTIIKRIASLSTEVF